MMLDQRASADLEQRLWPRQRQRTHALAAAGGQDHRFHVAAANAAPQARQHVLVEQLAKRCELPVALAASRT